MRNSAKWFLSLHIDFGGVCGQQRVAASSAAQQPFLSAAIHRAVRPACWLALVVYAVGWQQVIKHLPLTTAYANKAVTVVWGILLGLAAVWGEPSRLRPVHRRGRLLSCGIVLFVRADNEGEGGQ